MFGRCPHLILPRAAGKGDRAAQQRGGRGLGWDAAQELVDSRWRSSLFSDGNEASSQRPPPPRFAWSPSPALRAGADKRKRSRDALHPRFATARTKLSLTAREAERRQARLRDPHHRMRARALRGALASRRSTAALAKAFTPWLSPDRASCAPDRCLVGLPGPQCSELLADRSSCRTGGVLGRPGAGLRAPRASAALAPSNGRHRLTSLTEQDLLNIFLYVTNVKKYRHSSDAIFA